MERREPFPQSAKRGFAERVRCSWAFLRQADGLADSDSTAPPTPDHTPDNRQAVAWVGFIPSASNESRKLSGSEGLLGAAEFEDIFWAAPGGGIDG